MCKEVDDASQESKSQSKKAPKAPQNEAPPQQSSTEMPQPQQPIQPPEKALVPPARVSPEVDPEAVKKQQPEIVEVKPDDFKSDDYYYDYPYSYEYYTDEYEES
ncbi:hypothetical protein GPJ56_003393 [Histomonas meleagridis]|uniref:uncharacterized protein n=1 Tax=Histomonas meleagridis TaxID=135588 RepID=UPI0035597E07|nr:hypothetical protein GPJ56_003393 [Histomonas meleagridis]KAH0805012.1 hypothetical protein GO595_001957 [Histomonas meleagridis]